VSREGHDQRDLSHLIVGEPVVVDAAVLVRLEGELDLASSWQLRRRLLAAVSPRVRTVDLDLADVTFIDSSGLGTLVGLAEELRGRSVSVVVRNPSAATQRLLRLAALDDRPFGVEPTG